MKIYTKTGDLGKTSLFAGGRVDKDSQRVVAYGAVDELNSQIGVVLSESVILNDSEKSQIRKKIDSSVKPQNDKFDKVKVKLLRIQTELMVVGSDLATPINPKVEVKIPRIKKPYISRLEKEIDSWNKNLPGLTNFILPGGSKAGAVLHLARAVCRRAERAVLSLSKEEKINPNLLPYINRLSDWLFVLARYVNKVEKVQETVWKGRN